VALLRCQSLAFFVGAVQESSGRKLTTPSSSTQTNNHNDRINRCSPPAGLPEPRGSADAAYLQNAKRTQDLFLV
jgi:hypothetical protein